MSPVWPAMSLLRSRVSPISSASNEQHTKACITVFNKDLPLTCIALGFSLEYNAQVPYWSFQLLSVLFFFPSQKENGRLANSYKAYSRDGRNISFSLNWSTLLDVYHFIAFSHIGSLTFIWYLKIMDCIISNILPGILSISAVHGLIWVCLLGASCHV